MSEILLIDNYDSFAHNLARYLERLGQVTHVVRNDQIDATTIRRMSPAAIVLSPGPCTPRDAGLSVEIVRALHRQFPFFGVCLGHQILAAAWEAEIVRAPEPVHGRVSQIFHAGRGIFAGLENPFNACRYHSLVIDGNTLDTCFEVTARTQDGVVMAIQHSRYPLVGVQFHPESILTECGFGILANFLRQIGLVLPEPVPGIDAERNLELRPEQHLPVGPVTF